MTPTTDLTMERLEHLAMKFRWRCEVNIEQMANAREAAQESRERRQPRYVNLYMSVRMAEALDRLLLEIEPQPTSYEYHHVQIPVWKQKTVFYVRRLIINELQERNDRAEARKEEA